MNDELMKIAEDVLGAASKEFQAKASPRAAVVGVALVYVDNDTKNTGYQLVMPEIGMVGQSQEVADATRKRLLLEALQILSIEIRGNSPKSGSVN